MKLLSREKKRVFLHKNSQFDIHTNVDIVLSPELYWCRIFEIPIKKVKKAKKTLPILFEEIGLDNTFEYFCEKISDNKYLSFAYNHDDIVKAITDSGLKLSQVNNVYLAQGQMSNEQNFKIDDAYFQYYNNILVQTPYPISDNYNKIPNSLENKSNQHKINLKLYSNFIDKKHIETLAIILFMTSLLSIFRVLQYNKEIQTNDRYINKIKTEYSIPNSSIRFNSIVNNLKNKEHLKNRIDTTINFLLSYKDGVVENIEYSNKKIKLLYRNTQEDILEKFIKQKIKKYSMNIKNDGYEIEVEI